MSDFEDTPSVPTVLNAEALWRGDRIYPDHIYNPVRIQIATEILGKEIAKLVVAQDDQELAAHKRLAGEWFKGTAQELSPVHDFWCTFELLPMVKTKRLGRFVTAQNVEWKSEEMSMDDAVLTWMPFIENHPIFGKGPWSIPRLRTIFEENPELHKEASELNAANRSHYGFNRDKDPITIVTKDDGEQYLLDGNGRTYAAFMAGKDVINTWHGYLDGDKPINYWISTGLLKDLCYTFTDEAESNPKVSHAALTLLRDQLENNDIAKANYHIWIKQYFPNLTEYVDDIL